MIRLSVGTLHASIGYPWQGATDPTLRCLMIRSRVASILWNGLLACLLAPVVGTFLAFIF